VYVYVYVSKYMCIICACENVGTCVSVCKEACTRVCMCARMYTQVSIYQCIVCSYVVVCVHVCIFK
jgi:hypothetical protein